MSKEIKPINTQMSDYVKEAIDFHEFLREEIRQATKISVDESLEDYINKEKSKKMFNRIRNNE